MKKIISILLILTLALSLAACGSSEPNSYDGDHFAHETPEEMADYAKTLLERADFNVHIESVLNIQAQPDILMYNQDGTEVIGMYIYDPETGLATGWTELATGQVNQYEQGQEVNLGKPDPEKTVDLDTIKLGAVVYEKDDKAVAAELYFYLSNAEDATTLIRFMSDYYSEPLSKESETVYKIVKNEADVLAHFAREEKAGGAFFSKNAAEYIDVLKLNYGVAPVTE